MRRNERGASHDERWVSALKKALAKCGVTVSTIAEVISAALGAERQAVTSEGEAVSLGPHHGIRLRAAGMVQEVFAPRRAHGRDGEGRQMLVVVVDPRLEPIMFAGPPDPSVVLLPPAQPQGDEALPVEPMSAALRAARIREGKALPSGEPVKAVETPRDPSTTLPEAKDQGDGWRK